MAELVSCDGSGRDLAVLLTYISSIYETLDSSNSALAYVLDKKFSI